MDDASRIILDHYRERKFLTEMPEPRLYGEEVNRACGDEITLSLRLAPGPNKTAANADAIIEDISYTGQGCSICIASADILCQELKNMKIETASAIAKQFLRAIHNSTATAPLTDTGTAAAEQPPNVSETDFPGDIPALLSLRDYPIRRKCAVMAWLIFCELIDRYSSGF
ncbi:MAG: iron-sulfur cluster assembly scaffold protein [Salinispira sp.]